MIAERILIPDGSTQLQRIPFEEVDRLKRSAQADDFVQSLTSTNLYFYYKWNDQFGFLMADGGLPTSSSIVTVYYWRYPASSEEMTETRDPLLSSAWDSCLFYGSAAELSGENKWFLLYEKELDRVARKSRSTRSDAGRIVPTEDYN
jgi:hypothetical protein